MKNILLAIAPHFLCQDQNMQPQIKHLLENLLKINKEGSTLPSWHPFGFISFTLGEISLNGENVKFRLHIWDKFERRMQSPLSICHHHNWHLSSFVISGLLVNQEYSVNELAIGDCELYKVAYMGNSSISEPTGRYVSCALKKVEILQTNKFYSVPIDTYHSVFVPNGCITCTMVIESKHFDSESKNVRPRGLNESFLFNREKCDPEYVEKILKHISNSI